MPGIVGYLPLSAVWRFLPRSALVRAYNCPMKNVFSLSCNCAIGLVLTALQAGAIAQTDLQALPGTGRPEQTIQRIRTEDAGSRIDEIRVGGETQSILVQPKTGTDLPGYEVRPSDTARGAAPSTSKNDTTGPRVWNVLKF